MRRPSVLLAILAMLLALGLLASRVGRRGDAGNASLDGGALTLGHSGTAPPTNGEGGASRASFADLWRRSQRNPSGDGGTLFGKPKLGWVDQLFRPAGATPVSRETVERWLEAGRSNAVDLLALRQPGAGIDFLEKALREFPDHPQVLLASMGLSGVPSDVVRERLERFQRADRHNALPCYLAAANELAAGNREKALEHLTAGAEGIWLRDYAPEAARAAGELYRFEGRSDAEAIALGSSGVILPYLAHLETLANQVAALQQELIAAGDVAGAAYLARMSLRLGEHLSSGTTPIALNRELVGLAIEEISVHHLPSDASFDFLGGTAGAFRKKLDRRHVEKQSLLRPFGPWIHGASEAEVMAFYEIVNLHGERTALEWLRDDLAPPGP